MPSRKAEAELRVVADAEAVLAQPVAGVVVPLAQAGRPVQRVPRAHPQAEAVVGAADAGAEDRQ